jgi:TetR/AcrR family fatty acid metabolism transcriptional regulator
MNELSFIFPMSFTDITTEKKTPPNEKYQRIIDAAIRVFSQKGFYNAKVSDVAKVAEVADGTIYLYFKNKDDLLVSIFESSMDYFFQQAKDRMEEGLDPSEKLRRFIELHLDAVQKNQGLAQVLQIELRSSTRFMKEYKAEKFFQYLKLIEEIILEGQARALFKPSISAEIAKRAIFGAIDELALEWVLMKKKRYPVQEAAAQLCEIILSGLAAPVA